MTPQQNEAYWAAVRTFEKTDAGKLIAAYRKAMWEGQKLDRIIDNDGHVSNAQIQAQRAKDRLAYDALANALGANLPACEGV